MGRRRDLRSRSETEERGHLQRQRRHEPAAHCEIEIIEITGVKCAEWGGEIGDIDFDGN